MSTRMNNATLVIIISLASSLGTALAGSSADIVFDSKAFYDSVQTTGDGYVYVAGTLAGPGVEHPNNTRAITCYKDRMECLAYGVDQIGPNQIGRLDAPAIYPIVRWNRGEIVAVETTTATDCRKVTISIERRTEAVLWVEEPINHTSTFCKDADMRVLKWSLEDPPFWRK